MQSDLLIVGGPGDCLGDRRRYHAPRIASVCGLVDQAGEVQPAQPFRVGEDVDLGDLPVADGHADQGDGCRRGR